MKAPKTADHIEVVPCACGCESIKIWLMDASDKEFAVASFTRAGILALADHLVDVVDRLDADIDDELHA